MRIPTVKIPAENERGYKIVNADDPRAAIVPDEKPKRGRKPKEADND